MLVFNFISAEQEFKEALDSTKFDTSKDVLYDLSSSNINFEKRMNVLNPVLDFSGITAEFLKDYEENLKASSKEVFKYRFLKYPLFWMTELSEKHPYNIAYRLFLIKNDLGRVLELLEVHKQVLIYLPTYKRQFNPIIAEFFKKHFGHKGTVTFLHENKRSLNTFRFKLAFVRSEISKFKTVVAEVRTKIGNQSKDKSNTSGYIFTYYPGTWNAATKKDYAIGYINDHTDKKLKYIPFIHDKSSLIDSPNFELPGELIACFPGKAQTFFFCLQYFRMFFALKKAHTNNASAFIETAQSQMEVVLNDKLSMLFFRMWLMNFFRSIKKPVNVFYQDEFYLTGRIISDAAGINPHVNTYGVQHGLIFGNHSVYFLTKEETNAEFKMPMPKQFLVWGEYFKTVLKKHSAFPAKNIIVSGNLKFKLANFSGATRNKENVLLWCTGLANVIAKEAQYVNEILNAIPDSKVIVRMHPLHNVKEQVTASSCYKQFEDNFVFSANTDIQSDFSNSSMVLSTSSSGVVLEALFAAKIVIAVPSDFYVIEKIEHQNIFQPQTISDLSRALPSIKEALANKNEVKADSLSKIVYTEPDVFQKVLNFTLTNS